MDRDFEMDQIRFAAECIKNHFEKYVKECEQYWPKCPYHKTEMCQILKKGQNDYFECFEFDEDCKPCGHRTFGV